MTYYSGLLAAVPTANKDAYIQHAKAAWPMFKRHGATRMVESWGVDVPEGKVTGLPNAVQAKSDETVVFSWIEWPDKAAADAGWQKLMEDPDMANMAEMPFDGARMIFGGFEPAFEKGAVDGAGYIQGFALAVPEQKKDAYVDMAGMAWPTFKKGGALGTMEGWGVDVPHGKQTDFYRAAKAEDGEVPLFSWVAWPDRATCDAAAKMMEAEMEGREMPEMPFDGMRMMWGGFERLLDLS
ncbi:DUF1428 domain-containing protein [Paracoccus tegillarcae]|uniref:DUF1428 domain-containing protein n=1 Tax=Paracoccus tegillarcae TaxID=1529068 RepID=A0A2K9EZ25_9RHOB|nr:DUF1428 domain-containing protein [Paracoccus tegillarcae]AUH34564.1 DUF1428 domain-containing protein [Paracoccus tegillarcae]